MDYHILLALFILSVLFNIMWGFYSRHLFDERDIWKAKYDQEVVLNKEKTDLLSGVQSKYGKLYKNNEELSGFLKMSNNVNDELRRELERLSKTIQDKEKSFLKKLKKLGEKDELINQLEIQVYDQQVEIKSITSDYKRSIATHKGNYTRLKAKNKQLKWEIRDLKKEVDLFNKLKENTVKVDPETFKELEESFKGFVDTLKTELTEEEFKVLNPFYIGFGEKNDYKEGDIAIFGGNKPAIGRIMGGDGDFYWFSKGDRYNSLHYEYLRPATEGEKMSFNGKEYIQFSDELAVQFRKK